MNPNRFIWFDRKGCIRRAAVTLTCTSTTLSESVMTALHKQEKDGRYRYCNDPRLINARQIKMLENDVQQYINRPFDVIRAARKTGNGNRRTVQDCVIFPAKRDEIIYVAAE